jgi:succinate dehydrogenase/fumarate reductase-like Fe-S protein
MRVNGQARRACSTPMTPAMVLEPAQEGDLVKDLVVDQAGRDILGNSVP